MGHPALAGATPRVEVTHLRRSIQSMDFLAQHGLERITALSQLALAALEATSAIPRTALSTALRSICEQAQSTEDDITKLAEQVGADFDPQRQEAGHA